MTNEPVAPFCFCLISHFVSHSISMVLKQSPKEMKNLNSCSVFFMTNEPVAPFRFQLSLTSFHNFLQNKMETKWAVTNEPACALKTIMSYAIKSEYLPHVIYFKTWFKRSKDNICDICV